MILVIGPSFSGKGAFAKSLIEKAGSESHECEGESPASGLIKYEVQTLADGVRDEWKIEEIADSLMPCAAVTASETGCGIVPADPEERADREMEGNLLAALASRAESVYRIYYGISEKLK